MSPSNRGIVPHPIPRDAADEARLVRRDGLDAFPLRHQPRVAVDVAIHARRNLLTRFDALHAQNRCWRSSRHRKNSSRRSRCLRGMDKRARVRAGCVGSHDIAPAAAGFRELRKHIRLAIGRVRVHVSREQVLVREGVGAVLAQQRLQPADIPRAEDRSEIRAAGTTQRGPSTRTRLPTLAWLGTRGFGMAQRTQTWRVCCRRR